MNKRNDDDRHAGKWEMKCLRFHRIKSFNDQQLNEGERKRPKKRQIKIVLESPSSSSSLLWMDIFDIKKIISTSIRFHWTNTMRE